jgi:hypothetical protein
MTIEKAGLDVAKRLCENDPIRKNIPSEWRVRDCRREMFHLGDSAVICVAHLDRIPTTEAELMKYGWGTFSIFYTVWSSERGFGRKIIEETKALLQGQHFNNRYITMSPKTEMATKFHLKNGAILLQENQTTNNFEYKS